MSDEIFDPEVHATDRHGNPSTNKDGSFRKKRRDAGARGKTAGAAKKSAPGSQRARYAEGVAGLLQVPAMVLSFTHPVDGYSVAMHTPGISGAVADLAVERPEVAAALDRVLAVGPYGALIGAVIPLAMQLMHNHGLVPEQAATAMGATPKRDIERHLKLVADEVADGSRPEETPASPRVRSAQAA